MGASISLPAGQVTQDHSDHVRTQTTAIRDEIKSHSFGIAESNTDSEPIHLAVILILTSILFIYR